MAASTSSLQQQLLRLLSGVASEGTSPGPREFCCSGPLTRISPGLQVTGLGNVGLPLDAQPSMVGMQRGRRERGNNLSLLDLFIGVPFLCFHASSCC